MSVIAGIATRNGVYMAADRLISFGELQVVAEDCKIMRTPSLLLGFAGRARLGQTLEFHLKEPRFGKDPYVNVANILRDAVVSTLRQHSEALTDEDEILIAHNGQLFTLSGTDGYVCWVNEDYYAVGAGAHLALGSLHTTATSKKAPPWRLEKAVRAAIQWSPSCGGGVQMEVLE